jgi:NADH:ubiquinone oxidoreductase subunit E
MEHFSKFFSRIKRRADTMKSWSSLQHPDISKDMLKSIEAIIVANRDIPGSVVMVLRKCQDVVGYLPMVLIDYISRELNLSRSEVYGVASFYALFSFEPKGRHIVKVCMGTACYVKGIKEVISRISNEFEVEEGGTSKDRRFSLEPVRCLGACGLAPVVVVDQDTYGDVKSDKVIDLLNKYE